MEILDGFGGQEIQEKKKKVKELYREYSGLKKELEGYGIDRGTAPPGNGISGV